MKTLSNNLPALQKEYDDAMDELAFFERESARTRERLTRKKMDSWQKLIQEKARIW